VQNTGLFVSSRNCSKALASCSCRCENAREYRPFRSFPRGRRRMPYTRNVTGSIPVAPSRP
jgi:hypothetical protein